MQLHDCPKDDPFNVCKTSKITKVYFTETVQQKYKYDVQGDGYIIGFSLLWLGWFGLSVHNTETPKFSLFTVFQLFQLTMKYESTPFPVD